MATARTGYAMATKSAGRLLDDEQDEPIEPAVDPDTGEPNPDTTLVDEDESLEQLRLNYYESRRSVMAVSFIHQALIAAAIVAYIYFQHDTDYYGYEKMNATIPPPGDCCNCGFPAWKQFIVGLIFLLIAFICPYLVWTIHEKPRANIRLQIYTTVVEWIFLGVHILAVIAVILSMIWCNRPWAFFNWCNDKNWDCTYGSSAPTCHSCPTAFPTPVWMLEMNPGFLVFFAFILASLVMYIVTMIVMSVYSTRKLQYATSALKDPLRSRRKLYLELSGLAIGQIVVVFIYMAVVTGSILYLLYYSPSSDIPTPYGYEMPAINPPGVLTDESFSMKWLVYLLWVVLSLILPFVVVNSIYPTTNGSSKISASWFLVIWIIKDFIVMIILLSLYAFCNTGVLPGNPCAYPADPSVASPLFRVAALATLIQTVVEIIMVILFMVMRKLLVRLMNVEGDVRQHVVLTERTAEAGLSSELVGAPSRQESPDYEAERCAGMHRGRKRFTAIRR